MFLPKTCNWSCRISIGELYQWFNHKHSYQSGILEFACQLGRLTSNVVGEPASQSEPAVPLLARILSRKIQTKLQPQMQRIFFQKIQTKSQLQIQRILSRKMETKSQCILSQKIQTKSQLKIQRILSRKITTRITAANTNSSSNIDAIGNPVFKRIVAQF